MAAAVLDTTTTGRPVEDWEPRQAAAARLGAERRRLFLTGTLVSLLAPTLPYLTGAWEHLWFSLARTNWPEWLRAGIFLVLFGVFMAVVSGPLAYYGGHVVGHRFGLSRQTLRAWLLDWLKGTGLAIVLGAAGAAVFLWLVSTRATAWWWLFGLFLSAVMVLLVFLMPYVLVPLFFKMRPLQDESVVQRIHALADRAGARVREVDSLDFSRRTVEANAAVMGFGRSRRVVLADTLLEQFTPDEVDAVVAHELGHHVSRDVPRMLLANLLVLWLGLAAAGWLAPLALPILSLPSLGYIPGVPELFAVAELYLFVTSPLVSWWSRQREAAADRFALRVTQQPQAFASAMRRLAAQNLAEMAPPGWFHVLFGSHPTLRSRIERAERWAVAP